MQQYEGWDKFQQQSIEEKLKLFARQDNLFDVIYAQQFDRDILEELFELADRVRKIAKTQAGMNFLGTVLSDKKAL
jgi:aspartate carbamoyltransferase catalytic subunit